MSEENEVERLLAEMWQQDEAKKIFLVPTLEMSFFKLPQGRKELIDFCSGIHRK